MVCTFFGHRDLHIDIRSDLERIITDLIEKKNVDRFYVGNQGMFDAAVRGVLKRLKNKYPKINYFVVLAYMPVSDINGNYEDTIYPEIFEKTPPKFAIPKRNRWMIEQSDFVVTYVTCDIGGAANSKRIAEKLNKIVINIA